MGVVALQVKEELPRIVAGLFYDLQELVEPDSSDGRSANAKIRKHAPDVVGDALGKCGLSVVVVRRHGRHRETQGLEKLAPLNGLVIGDAGGTKDQGQALKAVPARVRTEHGVGPKNGHRARQQALHQVHRVCFY